MDTYEDGVGYKHIKIQPHIGGGFSSASASLKTYYGTAGNRWKINGKELIVDVEIPANTTATVYVPASNADFVKESGKALSSANIKVTGTEDGYVVMQLGSGKYVFNAPGPVDENVIINIDEYVGKYTVENSMIKLIEIKNDNGKMVMRVYSNSDELTPVKNTKDQFASADGSTVTFIRDANNKVVKIKMNALGMAYEGMKQ